MGTDHSMSWQARLTMADYYINDIVAYIRSLKDN